MESIFYPTAVNFFRYLWNSVTNPALQTELETDSERTINELWTETVQSAGAEQAAGVSIEPLTSARLRVGSGWAATPGRLEVLKGNIKALPDLDSKKVTSANKIYMPIDGQKIFVTLLSSKVTKKNSSKRSRIKFCLMTTMVMNKTKRLKYFWRQKEQIHV